MITTISLPLVDIEEARDGDEVSVQVFASRLLIPTPETVEVIKTALMERYRNFNIIEEEWTILISPLTGKLKLKVNTQNDNENDENNDLITYSSKQPYENNDLIVHDPRDTTSRNLGTEGEAEVYNRLVNLFPKLEVKMVSEVAHVADIHIVDEIRNITFIVEVKNKTRLTAEDIDKFKRDLVDMTKASTNRVIGLFISLICPIPRLGLVNIGTDSCYLAKEYTSDTCIDLVVRTYRSVYTKRETTNKTDSVKYDIPINVYKLLSELRMQSAAIESAKEIYCKQIEINKQSTANMYDLLAKADMQKHLIDFINNEFGDVVGSVNIVNNDEELLRDYLSSRTRKTIRQRDIRSLFPSVTSTLTLDEIWTRYGPQ